MSSVYCGIYDFELLPYALGDALTWNIQTALRCEEAGREKVDIYICLDPRYPSSIYQRSLVVSENCGLFFNELFGAFGTHPTLGNIFLYNDRDQLRERLRAVAANDPVNTVVLEDYERVLASRDNEAALNEYFIKYIYSHDHINAYAESHGRIPLLAPSIGCAPDVDGVLTRLFPHKHVVVIHPRLRCLDFGMGGDHTYFRDSDFLEWYDFVVTAGRTHPDVQFIVVGRLQEKPLALLQRPNVTSLRSLGLGLGHELTLMRQADLFIGTSSGFAAMANFSATPYFVTRMNKESCNAYRIAPGCDRLPFAQPNQVLIYETETSGLLLDLLRRGLKVATRQLSPPPAKRQEDIDVEHFNEHRAQWLHPAATTSRLVIDETYLRQETAFLLWPTIIKAGEAKSQGNLHQAREVFNRITANFPNLARTYPQLTSLQEAPPPPPNAWSRFHARLAWARTLPGRVVDAARRGTLTDGIKRRVQARLRGRN